MKTSFSISLNLQLSHLFVLRYQNQTEFSNVCSADGKVVVAMLKDLWDKKQDNNNLVLVRQYLQS